MALYIAEKPSLAEGIAKALAVMRKQRAKREADCWVVGEDRVSWLFGHMFELAEPAAYDEKYRKWSFDALPVVVTDGWRRVAHEDKKKHISAIRKLLRDAKEIVNCGDAGREGQLLVDELLQELGVDPFGRNVRRLWVRSMAEADMIEALRSLEPNASKKGVFLAAWTRQRADWLHGLNYTRLYTILSGGGKVISVGRVQTPTLKLVVDRDRERENFRPKDHYRVKVRFRHRNGEFEGVWQPPESFPDLDEEGRLLARGVAERVLGEARRSGDGLIVDWKEERKSKSPPLPHCLSSLQAACASAFGMTAKEVLATAQSLYETHRVATYPRTDSRHLPKAIWENEASTILGALLQCPEFSKVSGQAHASRQSPAWNDKKVSDHHAIIPTREATPDRIASLPAREAKVFSLIARSFVEQFLPEFVFLARKAVVGLGEYRFLASGRVVLEPGWMALRGGEASEDADEAGLEGSLPEMRQGDPATPLDGKVEALRTEPPPPFTDGTLIKAMVNVHAHVKEPELKKRLRETDGIGTEATRAEIIETLLKRGFLARQGRTTLISTELGRSVVDAVPAHLSDPGMTALWEGQLRRIEEGALSDADFLRLLQESIMKRVEACRNEKITLAGAKQSSSTSSKISSSNKTYFKENKHISSGNARPFFSFKKKK
jgi:DNA topoisomerase-3